MFRKAVKKSAVGLLAGLLLSAGIPALAAENAKVIKYGVDLFERPSFDSSVILHLTYERRVEVIGKTELTGTFEEYTGPWYRISTELGEGFIFGKYLTIDAGVTIPVLDDTALAIPKPPEPENPNANATITGDGVRMRGLPTVTGEVLEVLNNGTRVEVSCATGFSDTIDGVSAPWYAVSHGDVEGSVFGKFVKLDDRVTVPVLRGDAALCGVVSTGLYLLGNSEADFIGRFGQPISRVEKKYPEGSSDGYRPVFGNRRVDFGDVEASFEIIEGGTAIGTITYKGGPYSIWGLRIGSPVADVEDLLGKPDEKQGDILTYYSETWTICIVTFTVRNGTVVEITCEIEYQG